MTMEALSLSTMMVYNPIQSTSSPNVLRLQKPSVPFKPSDLIKTEHSNWGQAMWSRMRPLVRMSDCHQIPMSMILICWYGHSDTIRSTIDSIILHYWIGSGKDILRRLLERVRNKRMIRHLTSRKSLSRNSRLSRNSHLKYIGSLKALRSLLVTLEI